MIPREVFALSASNRQNYERSMSELFEVIRQQRKDERP